jgi:hypothetical protein
MVFSTIHTPILYNKEFAMKKLALFAAVLALVLGGCAKKAETTTEAVKTDTVAVAAPAVVADTAVKDTTKKDTAAAVVADTAKKAAVAAPVAAPAKKKKK